MALPTVPTYDSTDYQGVNPVTLYGDTTFGIPRPNYVSNVGVESVTSNMEFITISTSVDIRAAAQSGGSLQSQMNLNKLLEIVSLRGQPVIMGPVTTADTNSYFTIFLATEHAGGWLNAATAAVDATNSWTVPPITDVRAGEDLISRLIADGINYGFGANDSNTGVNDTPGTGTNGGLVVTFATQL